MKHEVPWTAEILEKFIKYGKLNDEQIKLMKLRVANNTDYQIAYELNLSTATYYRRVNELKKIYDKVQNEHNEMPKRDANNERLFNFSEKEHALNFINNLNSHEYSLEIKIIRKIL